MNATQNNVTLNVQFGDLGKLRVNVPVLVLNQHSSALQNFSKTA